VTKHEKIAWNYKSGEDTKALFCSVYWWRTIQSKKTKNTYFI